MQITARTARALFAGVAASTVLGVGAAHAADRTVEPLNQYAVSGRVTTDQLARAGYDLNEVKAIGKTGKLGIVATPAQAQSLRDRGATVQALSRGAQDGRAAVTADRSDARLRRLPARSRSRHRARTAARRPTCRSSEVLRPRLRGTRRSSRRR